MDARDRTSGASGIIEANRKAPAAHRHQLLGVAAMIAMAATGSGTNLGPKDRDASSIKLSLVAGWGGNGGPMRARSGGQRGAKRALRFAGPPPGTVTHCHWADRPSGRGVARSELTVLGDCTTWP
jgi:hypothetical protein